MAGTKLLLMLGGYVAMLLWGLHMVQTGVSRGFGGTLRHLLRTALDTRWKAFLCGTAVTALLQSSTATAFMLAGFLSAGYVDLPLALAAILGANVGTTLIVQVLTFDISAVIPVLLLGGLVAFKRAGLSRTRDMGRIAIGLGLMLLSLRLIAEALHPVEQAEPLRVLFSSLASDPVLTFLIGAALTWAAHSSVASVLFVMSLAATSVLPMSAALAFVLGANFGNTIPQLIATSGDPASRQLALGNVLVRSLGCVAALPFLPGIAVWLDGNLGAPAEEVAAFHMLFNVAVAILFLPLTPPLAALCKRLSPKVPAKKAGAPLYISLSTPPALSSIALADAARETLRMADTVELMLRNLKLAIGMNDRKLLAEIETLDDTVDALHNAIKLYLIEIGNEEGLADEDRRRCWEILDFVINLEHAGDILDKSLREIAAKKIKHRLSFSEEGQAEIDEMLDRVIADLRLALGVFMNGDERRARELVDEKVYLRDFERRLIESHLKRLQIGRAESLETSALHLDIARDLKRIASHFVSVAYPILEEKGALLRTRLIS
ncbi:Na/Pi cotransporter family protein [Rhodomicrobium sp.]|uniref:Na/Pi cotransporter family protein n=1 Tax=Rhodomicrobium sp. TaxID=2720632 RepID=UPI0039E33A8D